MAEDRGDVLGYDAVQVQVQLAGALDRGPWRRWERLDGPLRKEFAGTSARAASSRRRRHRHVAMPTTAAAPLAMAATRIRST